MYRSSVAEETLGARGTRSPVQAGDATSWTARGFRVAARVEAATWLGLLIGMSFKYVLADDDLGVRVFGPLHGAAFIAYVLATLAAAHRLGWSWRLLVVGLLASIPPAFTWPFERHVSRRGHLAAD